MNKLSLSALAVAAMAGSASAMLEFNPPIPFTQYDGTCDGDVYYTGEVVSIKMVEYGSFCVADNIMFGGETTVAYSRVDIVQCDADKIYENWNKCYDAECGDCEPEYMAYTGWDSIAPDELIGYCYDYTFSADVITKSSRNIAGSFENTLKVNFSFDDSADPADVQAYVEMMDENSCIAYGPPSIDSNVEVEAEAESVDEETVVDVEDLVGDILDAVDEEVSGATTAGATATVAFAAAATAMMMV